MQNTIQISPTMDHIMSDPRYKGKHVIVVAGKIFTAMTVEAAAKILETTDKEFPNETPQIAYIPDADTLIFSETPFEVK